jgi:hypothetical protein
VIGGTLLEATAYKRGTYDQFLKSVVPRLDNFVALPSLAVAVTSGVSMANKRFPGPMPKAVTSTMQVLIAFAVFWALADRTSQRAKDPQAVFWTRAVINIISCAFVGVLHRLMYKISNTSFRAPR